MATTYPLATLGPTLTGAGLSIPAYDDIYQSLQASFQIIYGSDSYIEPDSQDGQLLAIIAKAIHDSNQSMVMIYQSFSPITAVGEALSSNVKINGLSRKVASRSQVQLTLVGVANTVITSGRATDMSGKSWDLPETVVIPAGGEITVTATCSEEGAVEVGVAEVTRIATPTLGWQSVTNPAVATPGSPVETDAQLRIRQAVAVASNSTSVLVALQAAVAAVDAVSMVRVYENDTGATNTDGMPAHSISVVVVGGDSTEIATAIKKKKTPGAVTHGTTTVGVPNELGDVTDIKFFYASVQTIKVQVTVKARAGYLSTTADKIKQAVVDYINALTIGQRVDQGRLYLPAQLFGADAAWSTYEVNSIHLAISPAAVGNADVEIAFNQLARTALVNVTVVET